MPWLPQHSVTGLLYHQYNMTTLLSCIGSVLIQNAISVAGDNTSKENVFVQCWVSVSVMKPDLNSISLCPTNEHPRYQSPFPYSVASFPLLKRHTLASPHHLNQPSRFSLLPFPVTLLFREPSIPGHQSGSLCLVSLFVQLT